MPVVAKAFFRLFANNAGSATFVPRIGRSSRANPLPASRCNPGLHIFFRLNQLDDDLGYVRRLRL
jgi:hypothetical protein